MGVVICPGCGEENPDRFRLCGFCGVRLAPEVGLQEIRKTVTIVFSDLQGSTSLGERLDAEALREVLSTYFAAMRQALERHGGYIEKYIGDAVMAVFGVPRVREDDALRAVRAACDMRAALVQVNGRLETAWGVTLRNRTGVYTGEVVAGDPSSGQRLVTGDPVNVAARLEQACPAMEILIGESTYRLVRGSVEVAAVEPLVLRGKAQPVAAYRLLGVRDAEAIPRRLDTGLVGRQAELAVLDAALDRAVEEGRCQLVTCVAPAGVGKSRLLREFVARRRDTITPLQGRCLSYGDDVTFWPLVELVHAAAGITDTDPSPAARAKLEALAPDAPEVVERIASVVGLWDRQFPLEETYWATTKLLERLSEHRPQVVILEDIHWAEGSFRQLIQHLAVEVRGPVLVACSSRPDLLDEAPDWGSIERAVSLVLDPLSDRECLEVVGQLVGPGALGEAVRAQIASAAAGNPLYVEQLVAMLIDDGTITMAADGRWVLAGALVDLAVPPSITGLLAARLDRLPPAERTLLDRGAVVGMQFTGAAVGALCPELGGDAVALGLANLVGREFVTRDELGLEDDDTYRFRHALIRDTVYQGLFKRARAELHERLVDWFEGAGSARTTEFEEFRGYHLEQAHALLVDLGRTDQHRRSLGARGSAYLEAAGRRAVARGDMAGAGGLLRRAGALLEAGAPDRIQLLTAAGDALTDAGEFDQAAALLATAGQEAQGLGRPALLMSTRVASLYLHHLTEGAGMEEPILAAAEAAIAVLDGAGDPQGLIRAWRLVTNIHFAGCRYVAAEAAATRLVAAARTAGDRSQEERVLQALASCAQLGPMPVPEAIAVCERVLAQITVNRSARAMVLRALANLEAMLGDFARARALYRESRAILVELGVRMHAAWTAAVVSGPVELLAGEPQAAEAELRQDYEALRAMGERNYISTTAAYLAEALYRQGRDDEALAFTTTSEGVAAADDVSTQFLWRCVRGKVLARRGELEAGERLVREGVAIIGRADDPDSQGMAHLDLAAVLTMAGRPGRARAAIRDALARFERKGDLASARRARVQLSGAQPASPAPAPGSAARRRPPGGARARRP